MKVCIAEKPSVARDIARILGANSSRDGYMEGNGYQVTWTFGHLCTLKEPDDYTPMWKRWSLGALPMIPQRFGIKLINDKGIEKQFGIIEKLMQNADEIINCGDAGQEGELIQRWVMQKAGAKCPVKRLWISSMTDEAIREGFQQLKSQEDYQPLYMAGLSRAIGDWLLGMNATRLYTLKYGRDRQVLSIGRVQTPTLALIVQRQKEIDNFKPEPYWVLSTVYRDTLFTATKGKFTSKEEGESAFASIEGKPLTVTDVQKKKGTESSPRLYDLTSLQVDCNKKFSMSAEQTLNTIQSLYEKKLTTYPRVDTQFLSDDIYPQCPKIMNGIFQIKYGGYAPYAELVRPLGGKPLPKTKKVFDTSKVTDHHAIIPTGQIPNGMTDLERHVYDLVVRRFISVFYPDCKFSTTTVLAKIDNVDFKVSGKQILDPGWRTVYAKDQHQDDEEDKKRKDEEKTLPAFEKGESGPHQPTLTEKMTTPPKYYTEATLLRAMETAGKFVDDEELRAAMKENGIGRPSSRAGIIETLFKRNYIKRQRKNLLATPTGMQLIDIIHEEMLKSCELTGIWEKKLRDIEHRTYDAGNFISELKEQITTICHDVMADNTSRWTNCIIILLMSVLSLGLSSCGADKAVKKGDMYMAIGEYFEAAEQYKRAYSSTPAKERDKRGERALKLAEAYKGMNSGAKAAAAYRNAIRYNHDSGEIRLNYARQLMKQGNYREAAIQFQAALDSLPGNQLAREGLRAARTAAEEKQKGSRYIVKKMDIFNSRRAEYSPVLAGDQFDRLYFTSTRNEATGDELSGITGTKAADIFLSEKNDKGKWSRPEVIESGLNTEYDEGACCLSDDGRTMYITQCSTDPSYPRYATIATSPRSDAAWGKATPLTITTDTLSSYAHPAVSPDGKWLYFVSDMPGGKGGLDIWRARITGATGLGGVENLGEPINTPGDEMFPTFRPNGDLYFSSDGHGGLGGLDVFYVKAGSKGRSMKLEHPGYPLNSAGDDFGLTFEGAHNRGFFSSNRGDGRGWDHIYSFELPEIVETVTGWVYEMDGYELPQALVYMVGDDGTNKKINVKGDGSFTEVIEPGVNYVMLATCKGFLNHKQEIRMTHMEASQDTVLQFPLASIQVPVLIDNIFYDYNSYTLRPESTAALDNLVKMLQENPNVTIELSAHCDYRGSQAYNLPLSQKRAEEVVNYLISKGIAPDRLTPKGYGKDKPKTIRKKLTEKYPWLNEGDVLTEDFIRHFDDEKKQDICNQMNRRTEFIVLRTTYGMFDENGQLKKDLPAKKPATPSTDGSFDIEF